MSEPGDAPSVPSAADAEVARLRAEAEAAEAELRLARARADLAAAEAAAAAARARAAGGATTADGGDVAAQAEGPAQAGGPAQGEGSARSPVGGVGAGRRTGRDGSERPSPAASDSPVTADDSAAVRPRAPSGAGDAGGGSGPRLIRVLLPGVRRLDARSIRRPLTDAQVAKIAAGYAADGAALDLGVLMNGGPVASVPVRIPSR